MSAGPALTAAGAARRSWFGLAAFYAASFSALGVYMQFVPAWLHDVQGFSAADIAVILSAQTIARTLAGPLWAQWADRCGDARRVLSLLSAGALGAFALFALAPTLALAWGVAFVFGCLYPPMHAIVDAASVAECGRHGFSFGRLRVVGSLSFLLVILAVGAWLERAGTGDVYGIVLGCLLATAIAGRLVPRGGGAPPDLTQAAAAPWWTLLRSRPFVVVLLCSALIQGSHAAYYQLSTVHWGEHGIDKAAASILWAEGVLAEIVLLFFARATLDRLRPTTLLAVGGLGAAVRWMFVGATTDFSTLLAVNWLHALSFAATYLGALRALERRVPAAQRATAQGMLGAATSGGGMVFCGLCGGFVYDAAGGVAFYLMAAFAGCGALAALWLRRAQDRGGAA
ncbi:MAG: MFS transporter [Planctomycetota bacterium]|nr:MFS transporter [Planctomycetota bacterium]